MKTPDCAEITSTWLDANQRYLALQTQRLRLLLKRRSLWLSHQWRHDPVEEHHHGIISNSHAHWLLQSEDLAAELQFYADDPAAVELAQTSAAVEQELARMTQAMGSNPAAAEVICRLRLFHLTPFDRDVLLLCLAPDLAPSFETLYGYVQDDITRKAPTPHLALSLFSRTAREWYAYREHFSPTAPLRRYQLVNMETSLAAPGHSPLYLDERIGDYLRGLNRPDPRLTDLLQPVPPAILSRSQQALIGPCFLAVTALHQQELWPALNLIGQPDAGQQEIAHVLCQQLKIQLYQLDVTRLAVDPAELRRWFRLLERETVLLQIAYFVDATRLDPDEKTTTHFIDRLIRSTDLLVILASRQQWSSVSRLIPVPLTLPDSTDQLELWQQALGKVATGANLNGQLSQLVQQFHFGPQAITQTVTLAGNAAWLRERGQPHPLQLDDLWQACRQYAHHQLDDLAQQIIPGFRWADIVVPADIRQQLQEIAAQVKQRHQVYEDWGFGQVLSRGRGISVLFAGPSGAGKTMAAEILANELNLTLYRIDLAGVVNKYIGETEKNLRRLFEAAEQSGSILFFDEADALFGKRTDVKDSHDRYANIEIDYLLQSMEAYRGLAILATNRRTALDRAFLRRLRFVVDFPLPNIDSRRRIWQKIFPTNTPLDRLDYNQLAQLEITGGNIRTIALNAAFLAASAGTQVGMQHILQAARREYAKLDKLETGLELV